MLHTGMLPISFTVFINDIVDNVTVPSLFYADDRILLFTMSSPNDCLVLQQKLNPVAGWCVIKHLHLNTS